MFKALVTNKASPFRVHCSTGVKNVIAEHVSQVGIF